MANKKRVLIDCDPGVDDALALLWALQSPAIEVCAITTVGGNQPLASTLENALGLVQLAGAGVPVSAGAAAPLTRPLETAAAIHGSKGLANVPFTDLASPTAHGALKAMRAFAAGGPGVILALGPLTNVALFLLACPELKASIECICLMGGAAFGGNHTPTAEYNMYVDPEAAAVVFGSGVPIVMHGLDVTQNAYFTRADTAPLAAMKQPVPALAGRLLAFSFGQPRRTQGAPRAVAHDLCAAVYLEAPKLFRAKPCRVDVETQSALCRGCTAVDFADVEKQPPNALVVYEVDRAGFVAQFIGAMERWEVGLHG